MLLDILIAFTVISLVTEMIYRHYHGTSDALRYVYTKHKQLHRAMQAMDKALQGQTRPNNQDISVHYTHLDPQAIQGKPLNYSYAFESDFVFVTVVAGLSAQEQSDSPESKIILVSGMRSLQ